MREYTPFSSKTPIIKDVPVYDGSDDLAKGALLQRGGTGTAASYFVAATTGAACLGILLEDVTSPDGTVATGLDYAKCIISPDMMYQAEYDQTSYMNPSVGSSSTTVTIGSLEDDIDGGWIVDITDTDNVACRFITASASGSCTIDSALTVTTSSNLLKILPIGHRKVGINTTADSAGTKLTSTAAAGSGTNFTVVDNLVESETLGGIISMRYADRTKLRSLKQPRFYSVISMNDHVYA